MLWTYAQILYRFDNWPLCHYDKTNGSKRNVTGSKPEKGGFCIYGQELSKPPKRSSASEHDICISVTVSKCSIVLIIKTSTKASWKIISDENFSRSISQGKLPPSPGGRDWKRRPPGWGRPGRWRCRNQTHPRCCCHQQASTFNQDSTGPFDDRMEGER